VRFDQFCAHHNVTHSYHDHNERAHDEKDEVNVGGYSKRSVWQAETMEKPANDREKAKITDLRTSGLFDAWFRGRSCAPTYNNGYHDTDIADNQFMRWTQA
jgi:hypothetical protein